MLHLHNTVLSFLYPVFQYFPGDTSNVRLSYDKFIPKESEGIGFHGDKITVKQTGLTNKSKKKMIKSGLLPESLSVCQYRPDPVAGGHRHL